MINVEPGEKTEQKRCAPARTLGRLCVERVAHQRALAEPCLMERKERSVASSHTLDSRAGISFITWQDVTYLLTDAQ